MNRFHGARALRFLGLSLCCVCMIALAVPAVAVDPALQGEEIKDAPSQPSWTNPAVQALTGGPDGFGYTFEDSAEPDCSFQFEDIASSGTEIVDGDDTSSGIVALGATFNFYGVDYDDIIMAANGYLTLSLDSGCRSGDSGGDLSNDCPLPDDPSSPTACQNVGGRIYPLHDDLDLEVGIGRGLYEYFGTCPRANPNCADEDCTIFQWDNVAHFPGGASAATWNLQVILYHQSGDIVVQQGAGNPESGSGSTTGIMDDTNTDALEYACDTAGSMPDNLAVCFSHPNPGSGCGGGGSGGGGGPNKVMLCHIPPGNPENAHVISVGGTAVDAHMENHGDCLAPAGASNGDDCGC